MAECLFEKVFDGLKLSANVKTVLKNTLVDNLSISTKGRKMIVDLSSDIFIDENCIVDFREDLADAFPDLNTIDINLKYPMPDKTPHEKLEYYWPKIVDAVNVASSCCGAYLNNSKWKLEDDSIIVDVVQGAVFLMKYKKIDKLMEDLINSRLDIQMPVRFREVPDIEFAEKCEKATEFYTNMAMKYVGANAEKTEEEKKAEIPENSIGTVAPRPKPVVDDNKFQKRKNTGKWSVNTDKITEKTLTVSEALEKGGEVYVEGYIFAQEDNVVTKNGKVIVKFYVTDKKDSFTVKFFTTPEDYDEIFKNIISLKKGTGYIKMFGKLEEDSYENSEMVLRPKTLNAANPPKVREDTAPEKRVELHLHTNMSMMDAITPVETYVNRAKYWGHKAIGITDHGVVQAFPDAQGIADKTGVKVLYGCEGYMVNDMGDVVTNAKSQSLDDTYVVFDLETTGLRKAVDKIIEIGAVKVKEGKIIDRYSTFINPCRELDEKIVKLTKITDDMVKDAPLEDEKLPDFIEWCGDSVLVAHNAGFDVGFVRQWAVNHGQQIENTIIDTVELGKTLIPDLNNYKLDTLCSKLGVSLENHHRAVEDAEATAELFLKMLVMLKEQNITSLDDINELASKNIDKRKIKKYYHIIIYAVNQKGLYNLYKLVSESNLKYYLRRPKIPKSELIKYREGLIFGSACEAGDLYTAVYEQWPEDDLKKIVDFYDYLEIQPLGNNFYMINNQSKSGKSVESVDKLIEINKKIVELGDTYGKPVVATCDTHFIDPEDEVFRRIVQTGEGFKDVDNQAPLFYRTTDEMLKEFEYLGKEKAYEVVVTNTNKIADMMEHIEPVPKETFPPHMENANEDFERISMETAESIYGSPLPEVVEKRLRRELDSIIGNGYAVLYMIAQKLVKDSNDHGYIVGSRGSVGSSFAATMAGITEVNPLEPHYICPKCKYSEFDSEETRAVAGTSGFDLPDKNCPVCGTPLSKEGQAIPFETFLGFNGDKEPDIDLNFSGEDQSRAHKYCETLFGKGFVFKAGTISTLQEKTVYGYIAKYCEGHNGCYIKSSEKKRLAMGCLGVKRSTGQHPGGLMVVPSDNDILNFTPVQHPADKFDSDTITTHFDYHRISGRLLKLDMLGHDVPTILRMYKDITGVDPLDVPLDDKATYSLFTSPEALGINLDEIGCETGTLGLPEMGTKFVRGMLMETKPSTFGELVRISGLSHGTDVWNGNASELIAQGICTLKDVIATRDDIMTYLIQKGVENFTAFTIMEKVRKGKGLSADHEQIMREAGVPDWYIDSCKKIKYLFPKGHAVAYVTNTVRIGYYKIHYPYAFYAAQFSVKYDQFDYDLMCHGMDKLKAKLLEVEKLGKEAEKKDQDMTPNMEMVYELYLRGLKFAPIDLYESRATHFKVIEVDGEQRLLPPFCTLQGFGETAARDLIRAREEVAKTNETGKFETIEELQKLSGLGKKNIELLKQNGVLDGLRETDQLTLF